MIKHRRSAIIGLGFVLALMWALPASAGAKTYIHFLVVPDQARDGVKIDQALADFKRELIKLAGGYTLLGRSSGGALHPGDQLKTENNYSFLVSADRDISAELAKYISQHFKTDRPFVLVWEGRLTR